MTTSIVPVFKESIVLLGSTAIAPAGTQNTAVIDFTNVLNALAANPKQKGDIARVQVEMAFAASSDGDLEIRQFHSVDGGSSRDTTVLAADVITVANNEPNTDRISFSVVESPNVLIQLKNTGTVGDITCVVTAAVRAWRENKNSHDDNFINNDF
jgi:hypothetical protein